MREALTVQIQERAQGLRERALDRLDRLEGGRHTSVPVGIAKRFFAIEGLDLGSLLALELFTTVLPIVIIGYASVKRFSRASSLGEVFIRQMGIRAPLDRMVRSAFGNAAGLKSAWSVIGVAGFLVWGIPMSITVARMFARAWNKEPFALGHRIWRGAVWFLAYLVSMALSQRVSLTSIVHVPRPAFLALSLAVPFLFWAVSPLLLVRDVPHGWRPLLYAGLAGVVIDAVVLRFAARLVLPRLLSGWQGFGGIGVAFTLMTWCGVMGVAWVVTVCAGATLSEHHLARVADRDDVVASG